jgi:hypothetical protein
VVRLDVALAEVAIVLGIVKAADRAGRAVNPLRVPGELWVSLRSLVPAELSGLERLLALLSTIRLLAFVAGVGRVTGGVGIG